MDPSLRPSPRFSGLTPKTAAAATAAGILFGTLVGLLLPRGPVTVAQAVLLVLVSLALGIGSGLVLRTRWAMVLLPIGYVVGFELAWLPSAGLTTDAIDVGSPFGVLALLAGRGFHGLLTLAPMIVGATWSAGYRRQQAGHSAPESRGGRVWLAIRRAVAGAAVIGVAVLLAALLRPASVPPLTTADGDPVPGSVSELVKVPSAGGIDQWLSIRGADPEAPVMLYLPGGPGQSDLGLSRALLQDLTGDVVVATLDGRGIGKAYRSFDGDPTVDEAVDDVVAATDYLRRRFDEDRIFLFGESGGTVTGVLAVQRHPERFLGWIGSGQMVDPLETDRRLNRDVHSLLTRAGETDAAEQLESYGRPPYDSPLAYAFVMGFYDRLAGDYDPPAAYMQRGESAGVGFMGLGASEYTLIDKVGAVRGLMDGFSVIYPTWQTIDFRRTVPRLEVPVYMFTGDHELAARRELADAWFRALEAPRKHRYSYPNAGHATAFEHADDFRRVLRDVAIPESGWQTSPLASEGP